jgi:hypothetical protein
MAEMLLQKGMEQPQGQMISGHYVAPSIFQNLAGLANTYMGQRGIEKGEQAQLDLAKAIRAQESTALADYMGDMQGKPAVIQNTELSGPYAGNVPMPVAQKEISPAIQGNPLLANMNALQNPNSPAFLRAHAMKKITEGPNWAEVSQVNPKTGDTDTYVYDKNSADPKSTMRFVATSKPAISPSDRLTFQDKGIAIPSNYGGSSPVSNAPVNGGNMPVVANAPVAGGGQVNPAQPVLKPATTASTNDLVKTYGYDPFKPPPMPPMPSGEASRDWQKNAYKPLEGTAGDKVDGAKMYYNSLENYNNYVASLTAADLANPSVRQRLDSLYATAKLTGKEANKLGVLNGGDERILEEVLPNYKNITVTKKNLDRIIQDQKQFASGIIVEAYGTQQKAVPQNMRKFIVVPKTEADVTQTDIKSVLKAQNIPYDPSYEYKVNPDGTVARRKKQ